MLEIKPSEQYLTQESLEADVLLYTSQLLEHENTEGIPAPTAPSDLVYDIVKNQKEWIWKEIDPTEGVTIQEESIMNHSRIYAEFKACGLTVDYISDGSAYSHTEQFDPLIHDAIMGAHIEDDAEYITIDLESDARSVALKSTLHDKYPTETFETCWAAYLKLQVDMIKRFRIARYQATSDPVFWDSIADAGSTNDLRAWMEARKQVVEEIPYPGTYR